METFLLELESIYQDQLSGLFISCLNLSVIYIVTFCIFNSVCDPYCESSCHLYKWPRASNQVSWGQFRGVEVTGYARGPGACSAIPYTAGDLIRLILVPP